MKTPEDEAFDDIDRRQRWWGGGFPAKRAMAADKFIAAEERKVGERYGYVPKLHPSEWMDESAQDDKCNYCVDGCVACDARAQPAQEPVECLDCGSNNVGIPATYDSLVNSVKSQPAQDGECKLCVQCLERLIRIMGTFDLATGHADTFDELLNSLESELRDVLGYYRQSRRTHD